MGTVLDTGEAAARRGHRATRAGRASAASRYRSGPGSRVGSALAAVPGASGVGRVASFALVAAQGTRAGERLAFGTTAHAVGGMVGPPDRSSSTCGGAARDDGSVMASGAWPGPGEDGSRPSDLDAFCRIRLGWLGRRPVASDAALVLRRAAHQRPGRPGRRGVRRRQRPPRPGPCGVPCRHGRDASHIALVAHGPGRRLCRAVRAASLRHRPGRADASRALRRRRGAVGGPGDRCGPGATATFAPWRGGRARHLALAGAAGATAVQVTFARSQAGRWRHGG